ncbi:MAG: hypothetical protein IPH82_08595 [Chloroflexi bacterium]|nr:hypothetical protein [Chloroflexota bacterium]
MVAILDADGRVLAEGAAVEEPAGSRRWVYGLATAVAGATAVRVRAVDRPGNVGEKMVSC